MPCLHPFLKHASRILLLAGSSLLAVPPEDGADPVSAPLAGSLHGARTVTLAIHLDPNDLAMRDPGEHGILEVHAAGADKWDPASKIAEFQFQKETFDYRVEMDPSGSHAQGFEVWQGGLPLPGSSCRLLSDALALPLSVPPPEAAPSTADEPLPASATPGRSKRDRRPPRSMSPAEAAAKPRPRPRPKEPEIYRPRPMSQKQAQRTTFPVDPSLVCPICQHISANKKCLRVHLRSHSSEKPFGCPHCNESFRQTSNLNVHIRRHHGNRENDPSCTECDFTAFTSAELKLHFIRKHTNLKPFACECCSYASADPSNLRNHLKARHPERIPSRQVQPPASAPAPGGKAGTKRPTPPAAEAATAAPTRVERLEQPLKRQRTPTIPSEQAAAAADQPAPPPAGTNHAGPFSSFSLPFPASAMSLPVQAPAPQMVPPFGPFGAPLQPVLPFSLSAPSIQAFHPLSIPAFMPQASLSMVSMNVPITQAALATSVPHANPDPLPSLDALPPMPMTPTRARPSYGSYGSYGSEFLPLTPLRPLPFSPASLHPSPRPGPESGLQPSVHDRCLEGQRILDRLASMACDETPGEIWRQIKASQSPTEATYHLDRLKDYESQCVQF